MSKNNDFALNLKTDNKMLKMLDFPASSKSQSPYKSWRNLGLIIRRCFFCLGAPGYFNSVYIYPDCLFLDFRFRAGILEYRFRGNHHFRFHHVQYVSILGSICRRLYHCPYRHRTGNRLDATNRPHPDNFPVVWHWSSYRDRYFLPGNDHYYLQLRVRYRGTHERKGSNIIPRCFSDFHTFLERYLDY